MTKGADDSDTTRAFEIATAILNSALRKAERLGPTDTERPIMEASRRAPTMWPKAPE